MELSPVQYSPIYFIPEEEMDQINELNYETSTSFRYYPCQCGCCLSCVGISDVDFM